MGAKRVGFPSQMHSASNKKSDVCLLCIMFEIAQDAPVLATAIIWVLRESSRN